jgi:hypothetical protein
MRNGAIKGRQFGSEWSFWIDGAYLDATVPPKITVAEERLIGEDHHLDPVSKIAVGATDFELIAQRVMSLYFGAKLGRRRLPGIPKTFDLVSDDAEIIGDAKFYTLVRGVGAPSAKKSVIAEYVWLLEKTSAKRKFLAFGNDIRVPEAWLRTYGDMLKGIEFYFITQEDRLTQLR